MSELLEIIENIKNDPSVIRKIDIDELLKKQYGYIFFADIMKTNIEILNLILDDENDIKKFLNKLTGYTYIEDLYLFKIGRFVRWFNNKGELKNGGILTDIVFNDNGTNLLCKNNRNRVFK